MATKPDVRDLISAIGQFNQNRLTDVQTTTLTRMRIDEETKAALLRNLKILGIADHFDVSFLEE